MSRLILAPMEGVIDQHMRALLTDIGGIDLCVTEFLRVSNAVVPDKTFFKICPELEHRCQTPNQVPVRLQLLGQNPQALADNAIKAIELGAQSIDLNFGCPAKTVNKSRGGAILLTDPPRIEKIVLAVRQAIPETIPVSAKIRLGWDDDSNAIEIAKRIEDAGANELTIHARTKKQGYRPPAYWHKIAEIKQHVKLNIVANGEVWSVDDYLHCLTESMCEDIMLGRGMLANPALALLIKQPKLCQPDWSQVVQWILKSSTSIIENTNPNYFPARTKQWFKFLKLQYPEAEHNFKQLSRLNSSKSVIDFLESQVIDASQFE